MAPRPPPGGGPPPEGGRRRRLRAAGRAVVVHPRCHLTRRNRPMSDAGIAELAKVAGRLAAWLAHAQDQAAARVVTASDAVAALAADPGLPRMAAFGEP